MIPATTNRPLFRYPHVNDCVSERTRENVAHYATVCPHLLDDRLRQLAREWDIERVTAAVAGLGLVAGLALSMVSPWALLLPLVIAAGLLVHGLAGWSPLVPLLSGFGYRSSCEIAHERYALKALRGDFQGLAGVTTPQDREDLARFEDEGGTPAPIGKEEASDPHIINEALQAVQR